jgi:hypothetical protein
MQHIETLAGHHRAVWVEDPYSLIEGGEISLLQHRLGLTGHSVLAVESAFKLRQELDRLDPSTARVVIVDQSYTLRDPHLLPKDARPADLRPLPAPDWKPFLDKEAVFRPTVRDFLIYVTGDDRWPAEVNIYPYEKLARDNAQGFVQAYDTFRRTGRTLTTGDLVMVGASTVLNTDLFDINNPLDVLKLAFHSEDLWNSIREFFNPTEIEMIRHRLRDLPHPLGDLFSNKADDARLAITALIVLRQHTENPGRYLPILSSALAPYEECIVQPHTDSPAWFMEKEVPRFEKLIRSQFLKHLQSSLELSNPEKARQFARSERFSGKLQSLVPFDVIVPESKGAGSEADFSLGRLVPELMEAKDSLLKLVKVAKSAIERLRLTPIDKQTAKGILDIFIKQEFYQVDHLIAKIDNLIYYINGPAKHEWTKVDDFEKRWNAEVRECRDAMNDAGRLRDELDIVFGKLLEGRYSDIVPGEILSTDLFYERFFGPRRRKKTGEVSRAIVLVFDSMRYDIWRQLVKPMLEREYVIEEDVGFALLPSETRVSRRSFFAGKPPSSTPKSGKESDLFAELVSSFHGKKVIMEEIPQSYHRPGMAFAVQSQDKATTACVFDFADVLSHKVDWNPQTFLEVSKALLKEVQAFLSTAGPKAQVFVTADHGHVLPQGKTPIWLDGASDIGYRSAYAVKRIEGHDAARVFQIPAKDLRHESPGWFVFPWPGFALRDERADRGKPGFQPGASYRHGGVSLFEVVVPIASLRHREAPATVNLVPTIRETPAVGKSCMIQVSISADGIVSSPVTLTADHEGVEACTVSEISTTPKACEMRFTPSAPGKQTIRLKALLGEESVGEAALEVSVAPAPEVADKARQKLAKLFGED